MLFVMPCIMRTAAAAVRCTLLHVVQHEVFQSSQQCQLHGASDPVGKRQPAVGDPGLCRHMCPRTYCSATTQQHAHCKSSHAVSHCSPLCSASTESLTTPAQNCLSSHYTEDVRVLLSDEADEAATWMPWQAALAGRSSSSSGSVTCPCRSRF